MQTEFQPQDLNYHDDSSAIYDDDIRRSIPGYEELHVILEEEIKKSSAQQPIKRIVDLGAGTGITSERILRIVPKAELMAIDFLENMLAGAKHRLSHYSVHYILGDYTKMTLPQADIFVSVIGLHHQNLHQDPAGIKPMFYKIYDRLSPSGIFLLGDLMTYRDQTYAAMQDALHFHHLVERARDQRSLSDWSYHHRLLNTLTPQEDHVQWLKEAGFKDVRILYSHFNTNLIIARKI